VFNCPGLLLLKFNCPGLLLLKTTNRFYHILPGHARALALSTVDNVASAGKNIVQEPLDQALLFLVASRPQGFVSFHPAIDPSLCIEIDGCRDSWDTDQPQTGGNGHVAQLQPYVGATNQLFALCESRLADQTTVYALFVVRSRDMVCHNFFKNKKACERLFGKKLIFFYALLPICFFPPFFSFFLWFFGSLVLWFFGFFFCCVYVCPFTSFLMDLSFHPYFPPPRL
jgi:hypothetical protein